jgi:hypothetical protein
MKSTLYGRVQPLIVVPAETETTDFLSQSRNDLCSCGSGKKFKRCHGSSGSDFQPSLPNPTFVTSVGTYQQYILNPPSPVDLDKLRKEQLLRIEKEMNARTLVYPARISPIPPQFRTDLLYEDLLPFVDLLEGMSGDRIVVILETPGGSGETARDMVDILHEKFAHVSFAIPGMAKSAGTIMALGGHQILMGPGSSLGPIDAQLFHDGKQMSADELLKGLDRIKEEVAKSGQLSLAYIPFLQRLSPGELEHAINALDFAREAVADWLVKYKFANWTKRTTSGIPVTEEYKRERATKIAQDLSDQTKWKSHGRSLRIADLADLGVTVEDYSKRAELLDAMNRYYALLRVTFDVGTAYKVMETTTATVARIMPPPVLIGPGGFPQAQPPRLDPSQPIGLNGNCPKCAQPFSVQLDFEKGLPLMPGNFQFPDSGQFPCGKCGNVIDVRSVRADLERQFGRPALTPQPKR